MQSNKNNGRGTQIFFKSFQFYLNAIGWVVLELEHRSSLINELHWINLLK